jgi:hypothetical protein
MGVPKLTKQRTAPKRPSQIASDKPDSATVFGFSSFSSNQSNQVALSTEHLGFFDSRTTKLSGPTLGLLIQSNPPLLTSGFEPIELKVPARESRHLLWPSNWGWKPKNSAVGSMAPNWSPKSSRASNLSTEKNKSNKLPNQSISPRAKPVGAIERFNGELPGCFAAIGKEPGGC